MAGKRVCRNSKKLLGTQCTRVDSDGKMDTTAKTSSQENSQSSERLLRKRGRSIGTGKKSKTKGNRLQENGDIVEIHPSEEDDLAPEKGANRNTNASPCKKGQGLQSQQINISISQYLIMIAQIQVVVRPVAYVMVWENK